MGLTLSWVDNMLIVEDESGSRARLELDAATAGRVRAHARAWLDVCLASLAGYPEQAGGEDRRPLTDEEFGVSGAVDAAAETVLRGAYLWGALNVSSTRDFGRSEYTGPERGMPVEAIAESLRRVARPVTRRVSRALHAGPVARMGIGRPAGGSRRQILQQVAEWAMHEALYGGQMERLDHMQRSLGSELVAIALGSEPAADAPSVLQSAWIFGRHAVT